MSGTQKGKLTREEVRAILLRIRESPSKLGFEFKIDRTSVYYYRYKLKKMNNDVDEVVDSIQRMHYSRDYVRKLRHAEKVKEEAVMRLIEEKEIEEQRRLEMLAPEKINRGKLSYAEYLAEDKRKKNKYKFL